MRKFRDALADYVPAWLQDRPGLSVGWRFVWALAAPIDALFEAAYQGVLAGRPGYNYTALPLIGRSRGIVRGADDTDEEYAERLRGYLDTWRQAGRAECLARQLHEVLPGRPRVRIASRLGNWVTVNNDGSLETHESISLNWDLLSHPERTANIGEWWSEMWIVIEDNWAPRPTNLGFAGLLQGPPRGLSHACRMQDVDLVRGQILQWKSAHSYVRAILWSTNPSDFDPEVPLSLPDGRWGQWSIDSGEDTAGNGSRVASPRDNVTTRYWEPF